VPVPRALPRNLAYLESARTRAIADDRGHRSTPVIVSLGRSVAIGPYKRKCFTTLGLQPFLLVQAAVNTEGTCCGLQCALACGGTAFDPGPHGGVSWTQTSLGTRRLRLVSSEQGAHI
jgi:hypothetical protein